MAKQTRNKVYQTFKKLLPFPIKHSLKKVWNSDYVSLKIRRREPILVYQMGKVGSMSVHESLQKRGLFSHHVHTLDPGHLTNQLRREASGEIERMKVDFQKWLWLYNHIPRKRRPAKYITLVREPISRGVSNFFQGLDRYTKVENAHEKFTLDELLEIFHSREVHFQKPMRWLEREIKGVLGVDIYEYPFPHENGYLRITQDHVDLLIIRIEADDATKEQAIAQFLGLEDFELVRRNVGSQKKYAEVYNQFKQALVIPAETVAMCCDSKYMRHFYTPDEIEAIRARWLRPDPASVES